MTAEPFCDITLRTFHRSVTATCWVELRAALCLSDLNPAEGTTEHDLAQRVLFLLSFLFHPMTDNSTTTVANRMITASSEAG